MVNEELHSCGSCIFFLKKEEPKEDEGLCELQLDEVDIETVCSDYVGWTFWLSVNEMEIQKWD